MHDENDPRLVGGPASNDYIPEPFEIRDGRFDTTGHRKLSAISPRLPVQDFTTSCLLGPIKWRERENGKVCPPPLHYCCCLSFSRGLLCVSVKIAQIGLPLFSSVICGDFVFTQGLRVSADTDYLELLITMMAMMFKFAAIFLVVVGSAQELPSRWFPASTTTTSTTTRWTTSPTPVELITGRPVSVCHCCKTFACMGNLSQDYLPFLQDSDFGLLALNIDTICEQKIPAAQRCLDDVAEIGCDYMPTPLTMLQWFCPVKSEMQSGMACWVSGFQPGFQRCVRSFSSLWSSSRDACRAVRQLKTCAYVMMRRIRPCSSPFLRDLVQDYVRDNTLALCPSQ